MSRNVLSRLPLLALALLLLGACAADPFKPCEISVLNVRPAKGSSTRMLGALLGELSGQANPAAENLDLVVTLKVANPNDRGLEILGLSGSVAGPEGELGTFRLPPDTAVPLPAGGAAVVDILAAPAPGFLKSALPLLLSRSKRPELRATGQLDVSTWLGARRVEFRDVRLGGGS